MSPECYIGPRPNLLDRKGIAGTKRLEVRHPILTDADLDKIRSISEIADSHFKTRTLDITFHAGFGAAGLERCWIELCARAEAGGRAMASASSSLSDRAAGSDRIPIPSLLACGAVHHHLIRTGLRTSVGIVLETGERARGASLRLPCRLRSRCHQSLPRLRDHHRDEGPAAGWRSRTTSIVKRYIKAIGKGLLKVMSKMGISTYQSTAARRSSKPSD